MPYPPPHTHPASDTFHTYIQNNESIKVWVDLHRVPFAGRAPDLAAPLYERLLDVALRRAKCAFRLVVT